MDLSEQLNTSRKLSELMAVTVGFEPTVGFHPHNFSRVAPSATRTRHRSKYYLSYASI
jgi:hypothetical protein